MVELLTIAIANEYKKRASQLPADGLQDIGKRRELRTELQHRCGLTELQALNIINGFHVLDYIAIEERKVRENESRE